MSSYCTRSCERCALTFTPKTKTQRFCSVKCKQGSDFVKRHKPTHRSWSHMIQRCCKPTTDCYADYGGRGIKVCSEWRNSFVQFVKDMGPRPSLAHSIDRINNNGDYEPGNCRWATRHEQNRNSRHNRYLTLDGRTMLVVDWARELGIDARTIDSRLRLGWDDRNALMRPKNSKRPI